MERIPESWDIGKQFIRFRYYNHAPIIGEEAVLILDAAKDVAKMDGITFTSALKEILN